MFLLTVHWHFRAGVLLFSFLLLLIVVFLLTAETLLLLSCVFTPTFLWCVKLSSSKPKELKFAPDGVTEPNVCVCSPLISCDNVGSKFGPFFGIMGPNSIPNFIPVPASIQDMVECDGCWKASVFYIQVTSGKYTLLEGGVVKLVLKVRSDKQTYCEQKFNLVIKKQ